MSQTNVIATNANAEKLFNYLISYRRHISIEQHVGDEVTIEAIPLEESVTISVES